MSTVKEIETAIDRLTPEEYSELLRWMEERPQPMDLRLEEDLRAGFLDTLIDRAKADYVAGCCSAMSCEGAGVVQV